MATKKRERKPREDGTYGVPVSFRCYEKYLLDFADTQGGFSSYVKRLIYEDMQKHEQEKEKQSQIDNAELISLLLKMASNNNGPTLADFISPEYLKQFQNKSAEEKQNRETTHSEMNEHSKMKESVSEDVKTETKKSAAEEETTAAEDGIDTSEFLSDLFNSMH